MNPAGRKESLVIPETATREHLAIVLERLAEQGRVSAKEVNATLAGLVQATQAQVDVATVVKRLSLEQQKELLKTLQTRFEKYSKRHIGISWAQVQARLADASPEKLWSLNEMERTGGEPDVVGFDQGTGEYIFEDRSAESPSGRRNIVYDKAAEWQLKQDRSKGKCAGNMEDMAAAMGITPLNEARYRASQVEEKKATGKYMDQKTLSYIDTPVDKRAVHVALLGYCRDENVVVLGDSPYRHYSSMAFRGWLRV